MAEYLRERWDAEQGFPGGPVYAIAQTTDGYLWLGTEKGLVRFDGLNFLLIQSANSENSPSGPILGLVADAEGNLWIREEGPHLLRYRGGKFEDLSGLFAQPEGIFTAMSLGNSGEVLVSGLANGPARYRAGRFEALGAELGIPNVLTMAMAETGDGRIWLGTRDAGLFYSGGNRLFSAVKGLPDEKINCLLPLGDRELWIGTDNGVARWNGTELSNTGMAGSLAHVHALAMLKDRESNVWVGTSNGLLRLNTGGVSSSEGGAPQSPDAVTSLFEDREGNLWVGTTRGIERLRDREFTTYSTLEGLPSEANGSVYVDAEGRTWFAPLEGGLYWMNQGRVGKAAKAELDRDVIYSIAGGGDGLWIGRQRGGLTHLTFRGNSFTSETYTQANGLAQNSVYAVYRNRDGTVWAGTLSSGASQFRDGKFTTYNTTNGLSSNTVASILEAADGTMWFGTPNGLNALSNGQWREYSSREGLPPGTVYCLFEDSAGVLWIGTGNGLAFLNGGKIQTPRQAPGSLDEQILGIEEDKSGALWIATSNHVMRVNRDKLLRLTVNDEDVRSYGLADGLRSVEGVRRHRSVVKDALGRIWFSTNRGISFINPRRVMASSAPAIVHVEKIAADGQQFNLAGQVRVPAPHQRITLSYTGLSLAVPERVRYRYKLDGFDAGWSEPTAAREAVYTNLSAGSYLFHVVASNSDGFWNSSESTLRFEIEPAYWQSWWFRLSCLLLLGLAILMFFRLRVLSLTRQMNIRFEERLAERTRIAQELHDTLLQGFLSASMQLHVANDHIAAESAAKPFINRSLELMARVIDEGRNALRGLRLPTHGAEDLEQALAGIQQELGIAPETDFRVVAEGVARPLRPVIREEVYRIGREALVNAFRHSKASSVEVELEYASSHLRLLVRDNGSGIDPEVVRAGREGHWGLSGMRERAEGIGARLRVLSSASAGTEIELSVPGQIAFKFPAAEPRWGWLRRLRLREVREEEPKANGEKTE